MQFILQNAYILGAENSASFCASYIYHKFKIYHHFHLSVETLGFSESLNDFRYHVVLYV